MLSLVGCIIAFALLMILIMKNLHILKVPQHKDNNKTDFAHQRERVCGNPQALLFAHVKKERR